jgi:pimeloyl-ACP methyl ester carboxylesterase
LDSSKPSWRASQTLRLLFLDEQFEEEPVSVINEIYKRAYATQDKELMVVGAELALLQARKIYSKDRSASIALYVSAAELAYDYLFVGDSFTPENVLTPSYRFAAETYNRSVSRLVEIRGKHENPWPDTLLKSIADRSYEVTVERRGAALWDPTTFDQLRSASQVDVKGLRNEYAKRGLGAPLVGFVKNVQEHPVFGAYNPPGGLAYPVSAVVTFGPRDQQDGKPHRKVNVFFYDPLVVEYVTIEGHEVPLEADYSTPLGVLLANLEVRGGGLAGLFKSDKYADYASIYMLEPLRHDKIPVIMVHGLMSSPETWVQMFNDLKGNAEIRKKYQFWFFKYPTGLPINYSSSILRKQVLDIWSKYDPKNKNPHFNKTVLIGHSMGGMLSHTMMQDSKNIYWDSIFAEPIESLEISDDDKEFLREVFFFEHLPFVKRVIFIATPHRGSDLADKWFTKIGSGMINLPGTVTSVGGDIFKLGQKGFVVDISEYSKEVPNSLDHLSPSSNFVRTMNKVPIESGIPYHSIIGVRNSKTGPGSSDGVVPYESSHLDIAVSEKLVPSGHGAHRHPLAIAEVKRILLLHLEAQQSD